MCISYVIDIYSLGMGMVGWGVLPKNLDGGVPMGFGVSLAGLPRSRFIKGDFQKDKNCAGFSCSRAFQFGTR